MRLKAEEIDTIKAPAHKAFGEGVIVRLGNRLVHKYPMARSEQFGRLTLIWHAADDLVAVSNGLVAYLERINIEERP